MANVLKVNKRIEWIDAAKGIGLILVMLGHLQAPYLVTWIYTFHMPLFFFLSGVTTLNGNRYNFTEFLKKKIKSLVIPYFSLGIIIWIFYVIINCFVGEDNRLYGSNLHMLGEFFKQEHFWTIWFLAALFVAEIIFYWIDHLSQGQKIVKIIISVIVCIAGFVYYRIGGSGLPWNIDIALVAQFFLCMGQLFGDSNKTKEFILHSKKLKWTVGLAILIVINLSAAVINIKIFGTTLDMSVGLYGNEVSAVIAAMTGTLFIICCANKIHSKALLWLGQNTMVIFSWHSRIIKVLFDYIYEALDIFQGNGIIERYLYVIVTLAIMFIVLVPVTCLIKKSRIHAVFGV